MATETTADPGVQATADARLSLDAVAALARRILLANGVSAAQAEPIVRTVTAAERDECRSHGLYRLLTYIRSVRLGQADGNAEPTVHDDGGALVRVEGYRGFAPLAFDRGRALLVEKARRNGIAALIMRDCHHNSALWAEVEPLAAEDGISAIAFNPTHSWVTPSGGSRPLFGTNPIAFSWPRPGAEPFVFDFATSAVARGEMELHRRGGRPIPLGWAVDVDGQPTTDAASGLDGAMLPFGGYKGTGIQIMIELLAGAMIGDAMSYQSSIADAGHGGVPLHGELIIAFDPVRFRAGRDGDPFGDAEGLFERFGAQPGARLPSERRYAARRRTAVAGVLVPRALHDELAALA
ncbi:Ldh family oxidoreductase [Mesorhizobium sp. BR1-1-16]|uniref:Ldh family oxidoreductase n=1 Tax=Mesorhizobium sp. BR1-1-16 TaxID=2876653 RepID=UPI001CC9BF22|nr:Ldh family oxidoreductase [Mesorhizobium sp. BR1-1-16]MBZ9937967.1 Ldh family oxidoreductase [Mesorhizobium sp. BR1-1-16]